MSAQMAAAFAAMETRIFNMPVQQAVDDEGPIIDELIDLLWDTSPGAQARFLDAVGGHMDFYAGR